MRILVFPGRVEEPTHLEQKLNVWLRGPCLRKLPKSLPRRGVGKGQLYDRRLKEVWQDPLAGGEAPELGAQLVVEGDLLDIAEPIDARLPCIAELGWRQAVLAAIRVLAQGDRARVQCQARVASQSQGWLLLLLRLCGVEAWWWRREGSHEGVVPLAGVLVGYRIVALIDSAQAAPRGLRRIGGVRPRGHDDDVTAVGLRVQEARKKPGLSHQSSANKGIRCDDDHVVAWIWRVRQTEQVRFY